MGRRAESAVPGYYRLKDGSLIRLLLAAGRKAYCETEFGVSVEIPLAAFHRVPLVNYRPSRAELWVLSEFAKRAPRGDDFNNAWESEWRMSERMDFFLKKAIEFDYVSFDAIGYYGGSREAIKEEIGEAAASRFAHIMGRRMVAQKDAPGEFSPVGVCFHRWVASPTEENRLAAFKSPVLSRIDIECPETGFSFEWSFDGLCIKPTLRRLSRIERKKVMDGLKKEFKSLSLMGSKQLP